MCLPDGPRARSKIAMTVRAGDLSFEDYGVVVLSDDSGRRYPARYGVLRKAHLESRIVVPVTEFPSTDDEIFRERLESAIRDIEVAFMEEPDAVQER